MELIKSFFCQEAGCTVVEVPEGDMNMRHYNYRKKGNNLTVLGNDHEHLRIKLMDDAFKPQDRKESSGEC